MKVLQHIKWSHKYGSGSQTYEAKAGVHSLVALSVSLKIPFLYSTKLWLEVSDLVPPAIVGFVRSRGTGSGKLTFQGKTLPIVYREKEISGGAELEASDILLMLLESGFTIEAVLKDGATEVRFAIEKLDLLLSGSFVSGDKLLIPPELPAELADLIKRG